MPDGPKVDVSVVVSSFNRSKMLSATIESLLAQRTDVSHEVVIVNNNSTDDTADVIQSYTAVRYVFEPRQGVAYGRNAGVDAASGSLIAFTDDDVVAAPDWVERVFRTFQQKPEFGCIGGRVLPRWPSDPPAWLTPKHWSPLALLDYGPAQATDQNNPKCLVTANMAVRREIFEQLGRFDPHFQKSKGIICAGEDRELQERYWRRGGRCWFEPSLLVYAEVQPDRLTKAYHRRWHYGHGQFNAFLEDDEKNLSAYMWKRLLLETASAAANYMVGRNDAGFGHELLARYAAGYLNKDSYKKNY